MSDCDDEIIGALTQWWYPSLSPLSTISDTFSWPFSRPLNVAHDDIVFASVLRFSLIRTLVVHKQKRKKKIKNRKEKGNICTQEANEHRFKCGLSSPVASCSSGRQTGAGPHQNPDARNVVGLLPSTHQQQAARSSFLPQIGSLLYISLQIAARGIPKR